MAGANKYIGIDVGKNGGLCLMDEDGFIIETSKMPESTSELFLLLHRWSDGHKTRCAVEHQQPNPKDGCVSIATFFEGYGAIKACLTILEIPFETIRAKQWQSSLKLKKKSDDSYDKWKRKLCNHAKEMFPQSKPTLYTCDAILLANYYRRNH